MFIFISLATVLCYSTPKQIDGLRLTNPGNIYCGAFTFYPLGESINELEALAYTVSPERSYQLFLRSQTNDLFDTTASEFLCANCLVL